MNIKKKILLTTILSILILSMSIIAISADDTATADISSTDNIATVKDEPPVDTVSNSDSGSAATATGGNSEATPSADIISDGSSDGTAIVPISAVDSGSSAAIVPDTGTPTPSGTPAPDGTSATSPDGTSATSSVSDGTLAYSTTSGMWLLSKTTSDKTSSTTWTDIPGMTTTLKTRRSADLVMMYSSEIITTATNVRVRVLVDNKVANPGDVYFVYRPGDDQTHSFNFYKRNIARGSHTIRVQWRTSGGPGAEATANYRSLIVMANS